MAPPGTRDPWLSTFADCFLESANSLPCKRTLPTVSGCTGASVDWGQGAKLGKSLELMTKCLVLLHLEEATSPGVPLGEEEEYGAHQQTSFIFDEK